MEEEQFVETIRQDYDIDNNDTVIPHGDWITGVFKQSTPEHQPKMDVQIVIMHTAHKLLGRRWPPNQPQASGRVSIIADTGAQTCTSGPEILSSLQCPASFLLKTRHRINGITKDGLDLMGALLVCITSGDRATKQIMYVCRNTSGVFLSQTALKQLGVIAHDFPVADHVPTSQSTATEMQQQPQKQTRAKCGTRSHIRSSRKGPIRRNGSEHTRMDNSIFR